MELSMAEQGALYRNKRRLELEIERTLQYIGGELLGLLLEAETQGGRASDEENYIPSDSPLWQLMDDDLPGLHYTLSRVVAEIEGIDHLQAKARVLTWHLPLHSSNVHEFTVTGKNL